MTRMWASRQYYALHRMRFRCLYARYTLVKFPFESMKTAFQIKHFGLMKVDFDGPITSCLEKIITHMLALRQYYALHRMHFSCLYAR